MSGETPKNDCKSVDDYLSAQPEAVRDILERLRTAIRAALPSADELMSYKIPTRAPSVSRSPGASPSS
jgi:uncharacterized protein YdhG (YjbR/CyaY superfamily)